MYDHVLVGTDGSETATRAVEAAARLAHAHDARLTIAYAFSSKLGRAAAEVPAQELDWRSTPGGIAESIVAEAVGVAQSAACGALRVDTRAEPGHPVAVLLALADELTPDAVVVGNADVRRPRVRRSVGHALTRRVAGDVVVVDTVGRRRRRPAA